MIRKEFWKRAFDRVKVWAGELRKRKAGDVGRPQFSDIRVSCLLSSLAVQAHLLGSGLDFANEIPTPSECIPLVL